MRFAYTLFASLAVAATLISGCESFRSGTNKVTGATRADADVRTERSAALDAGTFRQESRGPSSREAARDAEIEVRPDGTVRVATLVREAGSAGPTSRSSSSTELRDLSENSTSRSRATTGPTAEGKGQIDLTETGARVREALGRAKANLLLVLAAYAIAFGFWRLLGERAVAVGIAVAASVYLVNPEWFLWAAVIGGAAWFVITNRTQLREVVAGADRIKREYVPSDEKKYANDMLAAEQSDGTQRVVDSLREKKP